MTTEESTSTERKTQSAVTGRILGLIVPVGTIAGLFIAAGTAAWGCGWVYIVLCVVSTAAQRAYVSRRNPDMIGRRKRVGKGTPTWDKVWNAVFLLLMLAMLFTAALDASRFHWSEMSARW